MTTKSRPIIMSSDSVRAILENRKSQTRRVMKPQPIVKNSQFRKDILWYAYKGEFHDVTPGDSLYGNLPYQIGDRLWVREAWKEINAPCAYKEDLSGYKKRIVYRADDADYIEWQSPMFMPRWASRLTLEITNVRCERVQDITCDGVIAEGYGRGINYIQAEIAFANAWDKLNAKRGYGWDTNPWVWVIEFKKIEGGDNE